MTLRKRALVIVLVMLGVLACDRVTKVIAQQQLAYTRPIALLGGTVQLMYVENRGAFLGLGGDLPANWRFILLVVFSGALIPITLVIALRSEHIKRIQLISLALIAGGGAGNLIDRLFHDGGVVDFVVMGIGPLRTGVFNVADVAITTGLAVLLVVMMRPGARGTK